MAVITHCHAMVVAMVAVRRRRRFSGVGGGRTVGALTETRG